MLEGTTSPHGPTETAIDPEALLEAGRRSALRMFGKRAAAIAATAAAAATIAGHAADAQAIGDNDILNFALNLEYLEAEFYLRAVTGQGLGSGDVSGTGTQGTVAGGSAVPFRSSAIAQYAQILAVDELTHVRFLRTTLGAAAIAEPSINFSTSFTNLAIAAGLIVPGQTFNPFADDVSFLLGAYIFEDVGVTAYAGASALISNPNVLTAAAAILGTEAYHGGAIRTLLANIGAGAAANQISSLRASLSGGNNDPGIIIQGESFNFAPNDSNGLVFRRTTSQVLNIVYGGGAASNYLFFPNKVNGTIQ